MNKKFSSRGPLTRSLPNYFPKVVDFQSKFSKLWKVGTPSIFVVGESVRPFWNRQTFIFSQSSQFKKSISIRKVSSATSVRKLQKPRFLTRYLVMAMNVLDGYCICHSQPFLLFYYIGIFFVALMLKFSSKPSLTNGLTFIIF